MGAPYAFPTIPPLLGQAMFWVGIVGLALYPLFLFWKNDWPANVCQCLAAPRAMGENRCMQCGRPSNYSEDNDPRADP